MLSPCLLFNQHDLNMDSFFFGKRNLMHGQSIKKSMPYGIKILSTNSETPKARLFINNCFELPSDWFSQYLNSQSEGSSKKLPVFWVPGFVLLKLCYL
jgi:hypothetical protein